MKLHVLMGQRKERYAGEYAPEALAVMDDVGHSDNPDYLHGEREKAADSDEFESVVIITVEVDGGAVLDLLRPQRKALSGKVTAF